MPRGWCTPKSIYAGRTIGVPLLITESMFDQVILGMDFHHAIGTRISCGDSEMTLGTPDRLQIKEGVTGWRRRSLR